MDDPEKEHPVTEQPKKEALVEDKGDDHEVEEGHTGRGRQKR